MAPPIRNPPGLLLGPGQPGDLPAADAVAVLVFVEVPLETVDDVGVVGMFTALALDAEGEPHISYQDDTYRRLKYAHRVAGMWAVEIVDDDGDVGDFNTSIAVDIDGTPHITYYDATAGALKYAERAGGEWNVEVVDDAADGNEQ